MIKPFWTACRHCDKLQKTMARVGNRKTCVRCEKSFDVRYVKAVT